MSGGVAKRNGLQAWWQSFAVALPLSGRLRLAG
jgi:hypothetical protein